MVIMHIMTLMYLQLDLKSADIKHSSLRTMAKHVMAKHDNTYEYIPIESDGYRYNFFAMGRYALFYL